MATPWSSETNWTVSRGSLDSAVTFESFDFPIDSESTIRKPPLLLVPPSSSDFEPCEIKLIFTQKHEICQVYVRSTARIYEIYYAPALQSDNEYLCTVRCSAASVEDDMFPETDVKESISVNLEGPNDILPKSRVSSENKTGSNEDDWVEVKLPVGKVDERNAYLPNQTSNNIRNYQDYCEATAEINDSEPCISLTLRLLSLQSKGCVYVDEVYVFADLIGSNDAESQTVNAESSAGSSLMTMLVPTLLGLTKSRSLQTSSKSVEKPIDTELTQFQDDKFLKQSEANSELTQLQDEKLLKQSERKFELTRFHDDKLPKQSKAKAELTQFRDEKLLKLSEAKTELTRFQDEKLLKLSEAKTELTRFQDEKLLNQSEAKTEWARFQDPTLTSDKDDFSYNRAESLLEKLVSRVSRIEDICLRFEENLLKPINSMEARLQRVEQQVELLAKNSFDPNPGSTSKSENGSQLCGEPELNKKESFSDETNRPHEDTESTQCFDEKEASDVLESPKKENPKKPISIDHALAAALAGFSSLTKVNDGLTVVPLESPEEECTNSNQDSIDTIPGSNCDSEASISCESLKATATGFTGEEIDHDDGEDSTTTSHNASTEIPDDIFRLQGTSEVADEEATGSTSSISCPSPHENYKTEAHLVKQGSIKSVKILTFDKTDILKYFPDQPTNVGEVNNGSESAVDFESPILEVKFTSLENGSLESNLEALLSYTDDPFTDEGKLNVSAMEEKPTNVNNLLVDLDVDGEGLQQDLPPVQQETSFASLI